MGGELEEVVFKPCMYPDQCWFFYLTSEMLETKTKPEIVIAHISINKIKT